MAKYLDLYGDQSWELDALDPATLDALIEDHLNSIIEPDAFSQRVDEEATHRDLLGEASSRWTDIIELLENAPTT